MPRLEARCEGMLVSLREPKGDSSNYGGQVLSRDEYGAELVDFFGDLEAVGQILDAINKEVLLEGSVGARTNKFDGSAQLSFRVTRSKVTGSSLPVAEQIKGQTSINEAIEKGKATARN